MMPLLAQVPKTDLRSGDVPNLDTRFTPKTYTRAEWDQRKEQLKKRILLASGLDPMPKKTPLHAQVFGRIEGNGYTIEKVLLETMPGFFLGGNLYRPSKPNGKVPAIVHPHGHWTYGRLENQPLYSAPTFGINLAKQGIIVFAYDMVGYNDTPQVPHRFTGLAEDLWQFSPLGLQTWNSIRSVDFLESLPDVDPKRIGASGASGGGTQTFLLAAIDERIAASAPVNMVSLIMQGGCTCENAAHLRIDTQNVELAALTAPRPQFLVAATGDWTREVPKVEYPAVKAIYALYGAQDKVENQQFDAPHNYHQGSREAIYTFFNKVFLGKNGPVKEVGVTVPDARDLLVLWDHKMPSHALDFNALFTEWRQMSQQQLLSLDKAAQRTRLLETLEVTLPGKVASEKEGNRTVLSKGSGDRVLVTERSGKAGAKDAVILIHPQGSDAALKDAALQKVAAGAGKVYALDVYQTGANKGEVTKRHGMHTTFNRSDDAWRVQDIVTAVAYAKAQGAQSVKLIGAEQANAWAILAAVAAGDGVTVEAPKLSANAEWGYDEWLSKNCYIPGLQRAGGISTALRLLSAGK